MASSTYQRRKAKAPRVVKNGAGRPEKYTKEFVDNEADLFEAWMRKKDSLFFKTFCWERGYDPKQFTEFAVTSEKFAATLRRAHLWQEQLLIVKGLRNETNAAVTRLLLGRYGYSEREKEDSRTGVDERFLSLLESAFGKSKSLVNDPKPDNQ